jgi:hypothetical protein
MVSIIHGVRASLGFVACLSALIAPGTAVADASTQEALNDRRTASSTASFRGEIDYSFDSALNKTKALYRTSLESANLIKRLLTSPEVHTLVVAYEFEGRTNPGVPDAVGLTLLSDEYYGAPLDGGGPTQHSPLLTIRVGETEFRYPVAIAEMMEVWSDQPRADNQRVDLVGRYPRVHINPAPNQVHVHRRATARIPICEFLILANGRDVRGTVAGLAFDLSDDVLGGLRRFTAAMAPPQECPGVGASSPR